MRIPFRQINSIDLNNQPMNIYAIITSIEASDDAKTSSDPRSFVDFRRFTWSSTIKPSFSLESPFTNRTDIDAENRNRILVTQSQTIKIVPEPGTFLTTDAGFEYKFEITPLEKIAGISTQEDVKLLWQNKHILTIPANSLNHNEDYEIIAWVDNPDLDGI